MRYKYITIEGNIGAGKTSLANLLARKHNARLVLEQFADNPFISKFYEQPDKFAFPFELFFVAERFQQLNEMTTQQDIFYSGVVTDYLFVKSLLFSKINLTEDEFKLFTRVFDIIYKTLPSPDLIVYLHCSIDNLKKKINKRGREYEMNIQAEYLENITQQYFSFLKMQKEKRILIVDVNEIDFVNNTSHFEKLDALINQEVPLGLNFVTVD